MANLIFNSIERRRAERAWKLGQAARGSISITGIRKVGDLFAIDARRETARYAGGIRSKVKGSSQCVFTVYSLSVFSLNCYRVLRNFKIFETKPSTYAVGKL